MENKNKIITNMEVMSIGSEKKMNDNTCKYKELHQCLDLCKALEEFKYRCELNPDRDINEDRDDVRLLLSSIQKEIKVYIPSKHEKYLPFLIDLYIQFLGSGAYLIGLLNIFTYTFQIDVKDKKTIEACSYVLIYVEEYISCKYTYDNRQSANIKDMKMPSGIEDYMNLASSIATSENL